MYTLYLDKMSGTWRIRCPDGRFIGAFENASNAHDVVKELNGLKNPD